MIDPPTQRRVPPVALHLHCLPRRTGWRQPLKRSVRICDFTTPSWASVGAASGLKHPGLSERELEVLQLIVRGMSNREIGTELTISLNTVARHVSNIFDKLGAANRTQAAAFAFRLLLAG